MIMNYALFFLSCKDYFPTTELLLELIGTECLRGTYNIPEDNFVEGFIPVFQLLRIDETVAKQMAQTQRALPQSKEALLKSYNIKLKDDIKSMLDNFTEIIKLARVEEDSQLSKATQTEQDQYEMNVRAANIVRAGESLMKLVSDLKQFLILNDFPSVNESINKNSQLYKQLQRECDAKLLALRDEMTVDLFELEDDYYSSPYQ